MLDLLLELLEILWPVIAVVLGVLVLIAIGPYLIGGILGIIFAKVWYYPLAQYISLVVIFSLASMILFSLLGLLGVTIDGIFSLLKQKNNKFKGEAMASPLILIVYLICLQLLKQLFLRLFYLLH